MKILQPAFCLLFVCLIFASCSNDDDDAVAAANINFEEKIVGTWKLNDREPYGIEVCELLSTLQFKSNGELYIKVYMGDDPGNCMSAERSGIWNITNGTHLEFDIPGIEENPTSTVEFFDDYTGLKLTHDGDVTEIYGKQ